MSIETLRQKLIEQDTSDGRLDGFLNDKQFFAFIKEENEDLRLVDLLDNQGHLAYAEPLDQFAMGDEVWKKLTTYPDSIPLFDALKLGRAMAVIRKKVDLGFRDVTGLIEQKEIVGRPINPEILFRQVMDFVPLEIKIAVAEINPDSGVAHFLSLRYDPKLGKIFYNALFQEGEADVQKLFKNGIDQVLGYLIKEELIDPKSVAVLRERMLTVEAYERWPENLKNEALDSLTAALAYRSEVFFPAIADRLWGKMVEEVYLAPPFWKSEANPFVFYYGHAEEETKSLNAMGHYNPLFDHIVLHGLFILDSGFFSNNRDSDALIHEIGHAFWDHAYDRTLTEWFLDSFAETSDFAKARKIAEYFRDLAEEEYQAVFGREKEWLESTTNQTHSFLIELSFLGYDFPEKIRDRLREEGKIANQKINAIWSHLNEFRSLIYFSWGFRGHPSWADMTAQGAGKG